MNSVFAIRAHRASWLFAATVVCGALAFGLVTANNSAGAANHLVNYQGRATGDPNSYIEFDAARGETRIVRIVRLRYARVDLNCKYGDDEVGAYAFTRTFGVRPKGNFHGSERVRYGKIVVTAKVTGKLSATGDSARGKIVALSNGDKCRTHWQALRRDVINP